MKDFLKKKIGEIDSRKQELEGLIDSATDVETVKGFEREIRKLNSDRLEFQAELDKAENSGAGFDPMKTYFAGKPADPVDDPEDEDPFDTKEYRQAFKAYVTERKAIPEKFTQKAAEMTTVSDIGAVIPTTVMNRIIKKARASGMILPRVRPTAYQGGVEIPVSEIRPTATWITETTQSDEQKGDAKKEKSIVFSYHMLECRVSLSLLSATVSLSMFEDSIVEDISEAMVIAFEEAIINGSGSGMPKGITKETVPDERVLSLTEEELGKWKTWSKIEGAIPLAYEKKDVYLMAKKTWNEFIEGATDANGQPIARTTDGINGETRRMLKGREVVLCDNLPGFAAATSGAIFAVVVDFDEYLLNSNLSMTYKKYFDDDKNKWVHKSIAIADGKMMDTNGMVFLKKA